MHGVHLQAEVKENIQLTWAEGILEGLITYLVDTVDKPTTDAEPVETVIIEDEQKQSVQQTVNNPFVFNFNQYGNNGTQIGHVENYYGGKKED